MNQKGGCGLQNAVFYISVHLGRRTRLLRACFGIALLSLALMHAGAAAAEETIVYEAEQAILMGSNEIVEDGDASQGSAVGRFSREGDCVVFHIEAPQDGFYDLTFIGKGIGSEKTNYVFVDGVQIGEIRCPDGTYGADVLYRTALTAGEHEVRVQKFWGWFYLDSVTLTRAETVPDSVYEVTPTLCNADATEETKALYRFLQDCYGKYTLSGQYTPNGLNSKEISAIHALTGKHPALLGLDMADYTPSRHAFVTRQSETVDRAIEYHERGGIVTFSWHWTAPPDTILPVGQGVSEIPWWHGYLTENCTFSLKRALDGEDPDGMQALLRDIGAIAVQLKRLEAAGVPVLWRPLHEASGGWFWWGADGPEAYKQLWILLYEMLTDVFHCNNLIWVCNCQDPDWYPGDDYVDIVGVDVYTLPRQYAPLTDKFTELTEYPGKGKIAALTENGVVPDIDRCLQANVHWSWFCTWNEEYVVKDGMYSPEYTEPEMLRKVYDSDTVLTLEDLPPLRNEMIGE